jgi:hypothetical protein
MAVHSISAGTFLRYAQKRVLDFLFELKPENEWEQNELMKIFAGDSCFDNYVSKDLLISIGTTIPIITSEH